MSKEIDTMAWLRDVQGVTVPAEMLARPARQATEIARATGASAAALSFGAEPADFWRLFRALADGGDDDL